MVAKIMIYKKDFKSIKKLKPKYQSLIIKINSKINKSANEWCQFWMSIIDVLW